MKVLFVCSGNSEFFDVAPFIKSQGDSLERIGIHIDYFTIKGKGAGGYHKNINLLRNFVKSTNPDIIHTHYSLSGWVSVFANTGKPMVLSLMGTDTHGGVTGKDKSSLAMRLTQFQVRLIQFFYRAIIVKSENLRQAVWKEKACFVIPNGVDYQKFKPLEKKACRNKLGLSQNKKVILFMAKIGDANKNYSLLEKAIPFIKSKNYQIVTPYPVEHQLVPFYYNACDVLIFPSIKEGSPNVIKEALACNTSIVATDSGDVVERVAGFKRVLICEFDEKDLAEKIDQMLATTNDENTREIIRHQIDEEIIAKQLVKLYKKLISGTK